MAFKVLADNGDARLGELSVNGRILNTPFLFPVVNFYCGSYEKVDFGGGIYRNIKAEFLTNAHFSDAFGGVLTSISQISDFALTKTKLEYYMQKDIHDWFHYKGILFVDSGGFKLMTKRGIHGKDFVIREGAKAKILDYQVKFGADIIASLDYPFLPNGRPDVREKRMRSSIENAVWLVENKPRNRLVYAAVHGHSERILRQYLTRLVSKLERKGIELDLDGIAIGSLVPLASNPLKLVNVVKSVKKILKEHGIGHLPIHVFGISSTMLPILTYLGVDTFDSASYIHAAINGTYYTSGLQKRNLSQNPLGDLGCNCAVCTSSRYQREMIDPNEPSRSRVAPVAMHNLLMHTNEIELMKEQIKTNHHSLENYLVTRFQNSRGVTKLVQCGVLQAN